MPLAHVALTKRGWSRQELAFSGCCRYPLHSCMGVRALLRCREEPHIVYGASMGPSSKGGILSCGMWHSQDWVLDPAQALCLKAAQQGSGARAEAVRWGREEGCNSSWSLSICLVWGKSTEKVDITETLKTFKTALLQGTERTESHWLIQWTVLR